MRCDYINEIQSAQTSFLCSEEGRSSGIPASPQDESRPENVSEEIREISALHKLYKKTAGVVGFVNQEGNNST